MNIEVKPWWVSEEEMNGLVTVPTKMGDLEETKRFGQELGRGIRDGIPSLSTLKLSHIICEYGEKDGLFNFHFYCPARYSIRVDAEAELERTRQAAVDEKTRSRMQQEIADAANRALETHSWPEMFMQVAKECFERVFKYSEFKLDYFPEVDSYSLVTPRPSKGMITKDMLEEPIHLINDRLSED